jgi:Na+/proline symporter
MGLVLGTLYFGDLGFQDQLSTLYNANLDSLEGKKADLMVPVFIIRYLPNGIIGILLVAILSAAMSSLSSTVNSLSAVTLEDFVKRFRPDMSDKAYVRTSRLLSVFWGLVCLFFAFFAGKIEGTVIEVINKIGSIFFGPILAIFFLAMVTRRTHALGANIGILTGVFFNMYLWLYVPEIFWFWWNATGFLITLVSGYVLSLILPGSKWQGDVASISPSRRELILLFSYFGLIVWLSASLKNILS